MVAVDLLFANPKAIILTVFVRDAGAALRTILCACAIFNGAIATFELRKALELYRFVVNRHLSAILRLSTFGRDAQSICLCSVVITTTAGDENSQRCRCPELDCSFCHREVRVS